MRCGKVSHLMPHSPSRCLIMHLQVQQRMSQVLRHLALTTETHMEFQNRAFGLVPTMVFVAVSGVNP